MRSIITILSVLFYLKIFSQTAAPGGVPGCVFWGVVQHKDNRQFFNINTPEKDTVLQVNFSLSTQQEPQFNFNAALEFNEATKAISFELAEKKLPQLTLFTVLHPFDSLVEKSVWFIENQAAIQLLLTTCRMADLADFKFMNFLHNRKDLPVINAYMQHKLPDTLLPTVMKMVLGGVPGDFPISPFHGLLAELIVYDRVLDSDERRQVETYLAIKYGIPLSISGKKDWLNANGKAIFSRAAQKHFTTRTTAIGRDDGSGLLQKQSTSSYESGFLTIGLNKIAEKNEANAAVIADNTFLFWADDNSAPTLAQKVKGQPHFIARKWRMATYGATNNLQTEIRFNTRLTNARLREGETWWLAIDRSGSGRFATDETEYFAVKEFTASKTAVFSAIQWDMDGSGSDVFAFGTGTINPADWGKEADAASGSEDEFLFVELYPNPAPGGKFQLAIALKNVGDAYMEVADLSGRILIYKPLYGQSYYFENLHIHASPGSYVVHLRAGKSRKSFPLIVE